MKNNQSQKTNHDPRRKRWPFIAIAGACLIAGNLLAADQTVNSLNKTTAKTSRQSVSVQTGAQTNLSDVDVTVKRPSLAQRKSETAKLVTNYVSAGESPFITGGPSSPLAKSTASASAALKASAADSDRYQGPSISRAEFDAALAKAKAVSTPKNGDTNIVNFKLEGK